MLEEEKSKGGKTKNKRKEIQKGLVEWTEREFEHLDWVAKSFYSFVCGYRFLNSWEERKKKRKTRKRMGNDVSVVGEQQQGYAEPQSVVSMMGKAFFGGPATSQNHQQVQGNRLVVCV